MKCLSYIVFLAFSCMANGLETIQKSYLNTMSIESMGYETDKNFYNVGIRKSFICKGGERNQEMEWIDPSGRVVPRLSSERVFQEIFAPLGWFIVPATIRLYITRSALEDSGIWKCRAGEKSKELSLCIMDPAEFVDTPTEVTGDLGRSITLTCRARGGPEPKLVWYRNGEILVEGESSKYVVRVKFNSNGVEGRQLTIRSLDREDSGAYTCAAIQTSSHDNNCTTSKSTNVTLNINYGPAFTDGNETIVFLEEYENTELTCSVDSFPKPTYRWFKKVGSEVFEIPQNEISVAQDGSRAVITLKVAKSLFGQEFRCRATNKYGKVEKAFKILKLAKPQAPIQILINKSSLNSIQLSVAWDKEAFYPVAGVEIQYIVTYIPRLKLRIFPDVRRLQLIKVKSEDFDFTENKTCVSLITLPSLEEDTTYAMRIRAVNKAGFSDWSTFVEGTTDVQQKVKDIPFRVKVETHDSGVWLYGLVFASGALVVGFVSRILCRSG